MQNVAVFFAALFATVLYAAWCGGRPERIAAALLVGSACIDGIIVAATEAVFATRQPAILVLDVATFAAVTALALRADRIWPMLMAAFLLVGVELQVGVWLAPHVHRQIYKLAHAYSAYPVIAILAVGVFRHRRRARRYHDRDWTIFVEREPDVARS